MKAGNQTKSGGGCAPVVAPRASFYYSNG